MAEASRSQFTITLGRSGQVVKRPVLAVGSTFSDSRPSPVAGSKRSVRERLGGNADINLDNKRKRGDGDRLGLNASNGTDDLHLRKDDLRFKIMKRTQSGGQQNGADLREFLSRSGRSSRTSLSPQKHVLELRNGGERMPKSKGLPEPKDIRHHMDEPRESRSRIPQTSDGRERMREPIEIRQLVPDMNDGRQRNLEPTTSSMPGRIHSTRSMEALPQMDVRRGSYSPWTLDHIRCRSPDRLLEKSGGRSPVRDPEGPQRRPVIRAYDDVRNPTYMSRDVHELPRPGASFMPKPSIPTRPVGPTGASQLPPAGGVPRSSYSVDDHPTVEGFLHSLGLEKYAITFKVEEVDMHALRQMGDNDLKELGIPMGPRKKIILALLARARRQVQMR